MIKVVKEKIKKKRWLKEGIKFFMRFTKRKPELYFNSPRRALTKAMSSEFSGNQPQLKITEIENKLIGGLSIYRDVISYPLEAGREKTHSGGLIDSKTYHLIDEAIHFNCEFCQELPTWRDPEWLRPDLPEIKQIVLFGGLLYNNFGHFLLESLGRLWAYEYVKDLNPYIFFYTYWGEPNYLDTKNFVYQVLSGFSIPHNKVFFLNYTAKINTIIVPEQKYGYKLSKKPDGVFMKFVNSFKFPDAVPEKFKNASKIYVSRAKLPVGYGKPIGESLFENYLAANGYAMFYPEQYTLYQQLSVYTIAKKIIFCDGSSIHSCILLPNLEAEVAIIARRKDSRWIPIEIADQFEGYGQKVSWIDAVEGQYQFGLESWYACSVINWYEVSCSLQSEGFVDSLFDAFKELDYESIVRSDLYKYVRSISKNPRFMDFLIKSKE